MWAFKRKLLVYITIIILVSLAGYKIYQKTFIKKPTCFDGIRNGIEEGVDCSGNCKYVCINKVTPINIIWAKNFKVGLGISNLAALVENPNFDYKVTSTIEIKNFDLKGIVVNSIKKRIILEPGEKRVLFFPAIKTGNKIIKKTLAATSQPEEAVKAKRYKTDISVISKFISNDSYQTQLQVGLLNRGILPIKNIEAIAVISDKKGDVFQIAKTFLEEIDKRQTKKINFTWQKVLDTKDVIIEVYPRVEK